MTKKKHAPRKALIEVNCPCGMIHQVTLGLGELQTLERGLIKGKYNPFKTLGNGNPEYLRFKHQPETAKEQSGG
jgi:hypothetical protein